MSTDWRMRFDTTDLELDALFGNLDAVLEEFRIVFEGQASPMIGHNGRPTMDVSRLKIGQDGLESVDAQSLARVRDIPNVAGTWWGVSMACVSSVLFEHIGRKSAAMETYVTAFKAGRGGRTLNYRETGAAAGLRVEDEELARDLYALQLALCRALTFRLSIYDADDNDPPVVTLDEVERKLHLCTQGSLRCSLVVAQALMSFDRARTLAGPLKDLVKLSGSGYILFPFIFDER